MTPLRKCPACGAPVEKICVVGRTRKYRGQRYTIPKDFPIQTCTSCKSEWMSLTEVGRLNTLFEDQRRARVNPAPTDDEE